MATTRRQFLTARRREQILQHGKPLPKPKFKIYKGENSMAQDAPNRAHASTVQLRYLPYISKEHPGVQGRVEEMYPNGRRAPLVDNGRWLDVANRAAPSQAKERRLRASIEVRTEDGRVYKLLPAVGTIDYSAETGSLGGMHRVRVAQPSDPIYEIEGEGRIVATMNGNVIGYVYRWDTSTSKSNPWTFQTIAAVESDWYRLSNMLQAAPTRIEAIEKGERIIAGFARSGYNRASDAANAKHGGREALARFGSRTAHRDEILSAMARALFVQTWANYEKARGRAYSGHDLMRSAPATPSPARSAAKILGRKIEHANGETLSDLFAKAVVAGAAGGKRDAETFGHYLAMQAVGHGVSWFYDRDSSPEFPLVIPSFEFAKTSPKHYYFPRS